MNKRGPRSGRVEDGRSTRVTRRENSPREGWMIAGEANYAAADGNTLDAEVQDIGEKIRQARLQRGMTQEHLAGDEYTKAFVSAVERGGSGISDQALEVFARRLGMPVEHFRTSQRSFEMSLAEVQRLLEQGLPQEALNKLEVLQTCGTLQRHQKPILGRWMGRVHLDLNRPAEALALLLRSLADFEAMGDRAEIERTRNLLGGAHYLRGNLTEAIHCHQLCVQAIQDGVIDDPSFALRVYTSLGNEYVALGDMDMAITHYEDALRLSEDAQDLGRLAASHWGMSVAYKERGDLEAALRHSQRALALYEVLGNRRLAGQIQNSMGVVHAELGHWERARQCYEQTLAVAEEMHELPARTQALLNLVEYWSAVGEHDKARALLTEALACAQATDHPFYQVCASLRAAATYQAASDLDLAAEYAKEAVTQAEGAELPGKTAEANFLYAQILVQRGAPDQAVEYFTKAYLTARSGRAGRIDIRQ